MKIAIRQANLKSDKETIINMLFRFLTPLSDISRFDWLYRGNPLGESRVWIAFDTESSTVIGVAGAFPRRVYVNGREVAISQPRPRLAVTEDLSGGDRLGRSDLVLRLPQLHYDGRLCPTWHPTMG